MTTLEVVGGCGLGATTGWISLLATRQVWLGGRWRGRIKALAFILLFVVAEAKLGYTFDATALASLIVGVTVLTLLVGLVLLSTYGAGR